MAERSEFEPPVPVSKMSYDSIMLDSALARQALSRIDALRA
jgi:hypothetical protein